LLTLSKNRHDQIFIAAVLLREELRQLGNPFQLHAGWVSINQCSAPRERQKRVGNTDGQMPCHTKRSDLLADDFLILII
jgi:hypothetical protein